MFSAQIARRGAGLKRIARVGALAVLACFGSPLGGVATAQELGIESAPSAAQPLSPSAARVETTGFRSAAFGMSEEEVRAAIEADFGLSGDQVLSGQNVAERTRLLSVQVDDVLPGGGVSQISYVFGYQSRALIQVGILWDIQASDEATLVANGEVLSNYFRSAGYEPSSIRSGLVLDNGILLFRGEDVNGRATVLLLQGQFTESEGQGRTLNPTALALLYAADADNPDVFRIESGQF